MRLIAGQTCTVAFSQNTTNSDTMKSKRKTPETIDEYIDAFPEDVRKILQRIRSAIRRAAPQAEETIRYQIPTFRLHGNLIHFAAYTNHIGIYPAPRKSKEFEKELSAYAGGKGTLKLPLDRPIPLDLIRRIVRHRVKTNMEAAKRKSASFTSPPVTATSLPGH